MGYCMDLNDANLRIPAANAESCLRAIQALDPKVHGGRGGSWSPNGQREVWFSWVVSSEYQTATDLGEAFQAWRWELRFDNNSQEWVLKGFNGEKLGDDKILFNAVAPYAKPGSYVEMMGEDGAIWRWVFDGETCKEKAAKITWED